MVTRISLAFAFLCRSAIWAADTVEPLNIKLGLWGTTRTLEMSGQPLMPPEAREAMAKMPPEQRAKAEEMMKEYANMAAKPTVHRDCLKKEDLDRPLIKLEDIGLISNLLIAIKDIDGHSTVDPRSKIDRYSDSDISQWAVFLLRRWRGSRTEFAMPVMWDDTNNTFHCPLERGWRQKLQFALPTPRKSVIIPPSGNEP